jgi:hypothetical protein
MLRVSDSAVPQRHSPCRNAACCLPHHPTVSAHGKGDFGAPWLACLCLLPMLHPPRYRSQRTGRGRSDWLGLPRRTLSFPTPSRFVPAFSVSPCHFRQGNRTTQRNRRAEQAWNSLNSILIKLYAWAKDERKRLWQALLGVPKKKAFESRALDKGLDGFRAEQTA